jgi:hypothetical protein
MRILLLVVFPFHQSDLGVHSFPSSVSAYILCQLFGTTRYARSRLPRLRTSAEKPVKEPKGASHRKMIGNPLASANRLHAHVAQRNTRSRQAPTVPNKITTVGPLTIVFQLQPCTRLFSNERGAQPVGCSSFCRSTKSCHDIRENLMRRSASPRLGLKCPRSSRVHGHDRSHHFPSLESVKTQKAAARPTWHTSREVVKIEPVTRWVTFPRLSRTV